MKEQEESRNASEASSTSCGMTLDTKFKMANDAQPKDMAAQANHDSKFVTTSKLIQSKQNHLQFKMKMLKVFSDKACKKNILLEVVKLEQEIIELKQELVTMKQMVHTHSKMAIIILEYGRQTMANIIGCKCSQDDKVKDRDYETKERDKDDETDD